MSLFTFPQSSFRFFRGGPSSAWKQEAAHAWSFSLSNGVNPVRKITSICIMAICHELTMHISNGAVANIILIIVSGITESVLHIGFVTILNTVRNVIHRLFRIYIANCRAGARTQHSSLYTIPFRSAHALNDSSTKPISATNSCIIP